MPESPRERDRSRRRRSSSRERRRPEGPPLRWESARDDHRKRDRDGRDGDDEEAGEQRGKHPRTDGAPPHSEAPPSLTPEEEEELAAARRAEEQAKLDVEMERRRQRVEQWQAQRRKLQADQEAAAAPGAPADGAADANGGHGSGADAMAVDGPQAGGEAKGWTLDGDGGDSDEEDTQQPPLDDGTAADAAGPAPGPANAAAASATPAAPAAMLPTQRPSGPTAAAAAAVALPAPVEDDVDPLDAFMAAQVLPEVQRLAQPQAEPAPAAPDGPAAAPPAGDVERDTDTVMTAAAAPPDGATTEGAVAAAAPGRPAVIVRPAGFRGLVVRPPGGAGQAGTDGRRPGAPVGARRRPVAGSSDSSSGGDSDDDGEPDSDDDEAWAKRAMAGGAKKSKAEKLGAIDHSTIAYGAFRKNFYIESAEVARMTPAEVAEYRRSALDGVKCRGKDVPRPIKAWTQAGLPGRVLDALRKHGCEAPMAIQAQTLPVIMSGRDCIGVAKTGSGKTLAFLLPLLRHCKDQEPLAQGDGPIGLVMAPTRELVTQIGREAKRYGSCVGLATVCVYGGTGVGQQISDLKRGGEIVVCTPGRMIDILASSNGRVTNLRRVTYLVLDEADRMFDMGFEPQISRLLAHTRPDRQTVMFSATFPHAMEMLARSALKNPVEVIVGGRSIVNPDIDQYIELRPEGERFVRLLELLGQWYESGKIIIFVASQERCDTLFRDLLRAGYPCLSLHGGKDQSDRECTIADFKSDVCNVLVATSVAARGLDVKELRLVVNYDVPNHYEEYVHRCGRTGRAGASGTAVTFLSADEERFAPDLVKALKDSGKEVPQDLAALADSFNRKRRAGLVQGHGSGFGGSGYAFSLLEDGQRNQERKQLALEYGGDAAALDSDSDQAPAEGEDDGGDILLNGARQPGAAPAAAPSAAMPPPAAVPMAPTSAPAALAATAIAAAMTAALAPPVAPQPPPGPGALMPASRVQAAVSAASLALVSASGAASAAAMSSRVLMPLGAAVPAGGPQCPPPPGSAAAAAQAAAAAAMAAAGGAVTPAQRAAAFAAQLTASRGLPPVGGQPGGAPGGPGGEDHYSAEIEINDFPQHARWKVTHKEALRSIQDDTGAVITTRGMFVPPGKPLAPGDRKLFLLVEGGTERCVREAKMRIRQLLEEAAAKELLPGGFGGPGGTGQPGLPARYSTF